jgi:hypothetical protein
MSVIITFMFDPAKLQMNWASAKGTSTPPSRDAAPVPASTCHTCLGRRPAPLTSLTRVFVLLLTLSR